MHFHVSLEAALMPWVRQYPGMEKCHLSCWWFPVAIKHSNVYWNKGWNIRVCPLSPMPSPDDDWVGSSHVLVFVEIISIPAGENEETLPLSAQNHAGNAALPKSWESWHRSSSAPDLKPGLVPPGTSGFTLLCSKGPERRGAKSPQCFQGKRRRFKMQLQY